MKESVLLTIDGAVNLVLGALLLAFPQGLVNTLGLPQPASPFYPAILGGVLAGIGLALVAQQLLDRPVASRGIEIPIITNLSGAAALVAVLVVGHVSMGIQGRIILWILALVVLAIGVGEIWMHYRPGAGQKPQVGEPLHDTQ
jgi:hypothetical protein